MPATGAMTTGRITQIQRYALEDGPGIRSTVFLKGCPLSCAWCHNPENIRAQPEIVVLETRCIRCGECLVACPENRLHAIAYSTVQPPGVPVDCQRCGACVEACPTGARTLLGREWSVKQLLREILTDRAFYEESGGGLTLSGGEPLTQFPFVRDVLLAARAEGLHTALDTCGFAPWWQLMELMPLVDLFLYDLKLLDEERHRQFTGVSNREILENLLRLDAGGAAVWLRIPVIPTVNDAASDLDAMARFAATLQGVQRVNLLPYHRTALRKFDRLNRPYAMEATPVPSAQEMTAVVACFRRHGLAAQIGG
jgi:pyruvate formate lyase activating enzyme